MMMTEEETRDAEARREADAGASTTTTRTRRTFGGRGREVVRTRESFGGVRGCYLWTRCRGMGGDFAEGDGGATGAGASRVRARG